MNMKIVFMSILTLQVYLIFYIIQFVNSIYIGKHHYTNVDTDVNTNVVENLNPEYIDNRDYVDKPDEKNYTGVVYVIQYSVQPPTKYYVGWTSNLTRRIEEHNTNRGSKWTKSFPSSYTLWRLDGPLDIIATTKSNCKNPRKSDCVIEDCITYKTMMKYGIENVRGGSWHCPDLTHQYCNKPIVNKCELDIDDMIHFRKGYEIEQFQPILIALEEKKDAFVFSINQFYRLSRDRDISTDFRNLRYPSINDYSSNIENIENIENIGDKWYYKVLIWDNSFIYSEIILDNKILKLADNSSFVYKNNVLIYKKINTFLLRISIIYRYKDEYFNIYKPNNPHRTEDSPQYLLFKKVREYEKKV